MPDRPDARGRLPRGAFVVVVLVSVVVLFAPGDDVPAALPGVDKLVHLLLFAALAVTGRWAGARAPVLAVWLAGYAAVSEVLQAVAPLARSGSVADLVADLVGMSVGLVGWHAGRRVGSALRRGAAPGSLGR